jgi:hypothetical protein
MLVPAMSPMEIYKEIVEDGVNVMRTVTTKMHIQAHVMKRTNQFKWVETLHIKSARNNHWSVTINITGTVKNVNMYVKTDDKQGLTAYSVLMLQEIPMLIKYNAHFFKRYRERMFLEETKPDQVLKKFFRNNIHITPAYSEKAEDGTIMAAISLPEGMGLGRFSDSSPITEMKTFIAHGTLNKGQRELIQMLNEDESYQDGISFIGGSTVKAH